MLSPRNSRSPLPRCETGRRRTANPGRHRTEFSADAIPSAGSWASIAEAGKVNSILRLGPKLPVARLLVTTGVIITPCTPGSTNPNCPDASADVAVAGNNRITWSPPKAVNIAFAARTSAAPQIPASHDFLPWQTEPQFGRSPRTTASTTQPVFPTRPFAPHTAPVNCEPCHPPTLAQNIATASG